MRHLNKIIFLNSANIPYAEVSLDGNVHFAGTQGVGKSTILRALLFFYNADKMHLGIQSGQKSFEEFYFRHSNSYIVYEVKTDYSAYSILLSRSQGKAVFRFIDAPYMKEWFVGSDGRVESDWIRIRERIGSSIEISAKIDTYDQYRNIIFGNTHDRGHHFDKYAIVESSKYQNIPRSIQNVFLNSKLDADFVKNTIIQSMVDSDVSIQLSAYRGLVADFEREFDEINCWYKKDKNGEIIVRTKAQKVVDVYRLIIALEYEMRKVWHELNFSVAFSRDQIPILEDEKEKQQINQEKNKEKIAGVKKEYDQEHESLTKKIGACDVRLNDIKRKRKAYDELNIKAIIERNEQEPKYKNEIRQKTSLLQTLQNEFRDIAEKYKALYNSLESEKKVFDLSQKEAQQSFRDSIQTERENNITTRDNRKRNIDKTYDELFADSEERTAVFLEEYNRADKRLSELRYWHPLKQEIDSCDNAIKVLKEEENKLRGELAVCQSDQKLIQQTALSERTQVEQEYQRKLEDLQKEIQQIQTELDKINNILSHWNGSLYEWLTENKPGWEENIGKVIDEHQVLYAQNLAPNLTGGNSLFGVSLNLDTISSHHHTLDEYRSLQQEYQESIKGKKKEFEDIQQELKKTMESITKRYKDKLHELQQNETNIRLQLSIMPTKVKDAQTCLHQQENKQQKMIKEEGQKRTEAFNQAKLNLENEKSAITKQRAKREKEMKTVDSEYNSKIKDIEKRIKEFQQKQISENVEYERFWIENRKTIEEQERDELKGKGADTNAIEQCRREIARVQKNLDRISDERHYVYEFRKDDVELFSHEAEYHEEKRQLQSRDEGVHKSYEDKLNRLLAEKQEINKKIDDIKSQLDKHQEGLKQYTQLCEVENVIPEEFIQDDKSEKTATSCSELVTQIRGAVNKRRQKQEELKRSINTFNSHFGLNNTFHFIIPQYDEEYLSFAVNLLEFIENEKIEDYRIRVSDHYHTILRTVSREVGLLMNHSAEIKNIINEVNNDFRERNFAGVIRSIELKAEESSDRMMQLLCSIRDFTEENTLSIGELNLFSGSDHDKVNEKVVDYLKKFMQQLQKEPSRTELTLSDTFRLQFRIQENDNNTGWVERINNVGSDGTDILVKAMVNIMLINVFKTKASRKNGDFIIHCMMDEIGKLHPSNVSGILQFANVRNIYLINSSPMGYNADIYKYNYLLTKDSKSQTHVKRLLTVNN